MAKAKVSSKNEDLKSGKLLVIKSYVNRFRNHPMFTKNMPAVKTLFIIVLITVIGLAWNKIYEGQRDINQNLSSSEEISDMSIIRTPKLDQNYETSSDEPKTYIEPVKSEPLTLSFMNEVKQALLKESEISEKNLVTQVDYDMDSLGGADQRIWWTKDGYTIILGGESIIIEFAIDDGSSHVYDEVINNSNLLKAQTVTSKVLTDLDFNELSNIGNEHWDYTVGYQKDNYICASISSQEIAGPMYTTVTYQNGQVIKYTLVCTTKDNITDELKDKKPFLDAAKLKNTGISLNLSINQEAQNSRIVTFNGSQGRSGAAYTFYLDGDNWRFIDVGQDIISCSTLVSEKIPKQYWINCWDDNTNKVIEY